MNDFLKMDIFFFVATAAAVVFGILVALVLFRVWRILGQVERITEATADEAVLVREDIAHLRKNIREEGLRFKHLLRFMRTSLTRLFKTKGK